MRPAGNRIPQSTLHRWRDHTYARRYLEIKTEIQGENREVQAARAEDIVSRATDADELLVDRVIANADVPIEDSKDVANMARAAASVAQVADIHQRNANLLREKPTQISRLENPAELIRELEALGVAKRRESTSLLAADARGTPGGGTPSADVTTHGFAIRSSCLGSGMRGNEGASRSASREALRM